MKRALVSWIALLLLAPAAFAGKVTTVDLLASLGLRVNAAGPLLLRLDAGRQRLVLANTLSSSLTLIDCASRAVRNIPLATRVPQHLKAEALAIDGRSGNVYVIGDHSLEVAFPETGASRSFATGRQYEMVAVDEASGDAFLVGSESGDIAWVRLRQNRIVTRPWCQAQPAAGNLNQTPPPPLRKVVCDAATRLVAAVDGHSATLHRFAADGLRPLGSRPLPLEPGGRWHYAGTAPAQKSLLLVKETAARRVVQAAKIDLAGAADVIVPLPGLSEGVGIGYSAERDETYIAYDNHPSLHVVDFGGNSLTEIKLPAYGNDAIALTGDRLYVASWAWGEIDEVDLISRRLRRRFTQVPVLPHMFAMACNPADGRLYIPLGATAVNGSFGAAVSVFDPARETLEKIRTGWAPRELLPQPGSAHFLAFSSEDQMARIAPDGGFTIAPLPVTYPHQALAAPQGWIYLAYGPHQSYWPVVYIWAARNGVLGIQGSDLSFCDRRLPRLAQAMALSPAGVLFALQNNWGDEKQFYVTLPDEVRAPNLGDMRVELADTVSRETTQRLIAHDAGRDWLLICRCGERDADNGVLQVIDAGSGRVVRRLEVGVTPTALASDQASVYVVNFDSGTLSVIAKEGFARRDIPCGRQPLKMALAGGVPYVIGHGDNTLYEAGETPRRHRIPFPGLPDQIACRQRDGRLLITSHSADALYIYSFDTRSKRFALQHREPYPYGQVSFAGSNSSFFLRGQFGDGLYDLCRIHWDRQGGGDTAWVSDFLSGKVFIVAD